MKRLSGRDCEAVVYSVKKSTQFSAKISPLGVKQPSCPEKKTAKTNFSVHQNSQPPGGRLMGILVEGVLPGSPNPDPTSDRKMSFFSSVFRPRL